MPVRVPEERWGRQGSKLRPRDYESPALTTAALPRASDLGFCPPSVFLSQGVPCSYMPSLLESDDSPVIRVASQIDGKPPFSDCRSYSSHTRRTSEGASR